MRIARAHTQVTYKNIINITTNIERVFFWWVCSAAPTVQTKLNQFVWAFVTLHLMVDCSHFRWEYTRESTEQMKYTSIDRIWFRIFFFYVSVVFCTSLFGFPQIVHIEQETTEKMACEFITLLDSDDYTALIIMIFMFAQFWCDFFSWYNNGNQSAQLHAYCGIDFCNIRKWNMFFAACRHLYWESPDERNSIQNDSR